VSYRFDFSQRLRGLLAYEVLALTAILIGGGLGAYLSIGFPAWSAKHPGLPTLAFILASIAFAAAFSYAFVWSRSQRRRLPPEWSVASTICEVAGELTKPGSADRLWLGSELVEILSPLSAARDWFVASFPAGRWGRIATQAADARFDQIDRSIARIATSGIADREAGWRVACEAALAIFAANSPETAGDGDVITSSTGFKKAPLVIALASVILSSGVALILAPTAIGPVLAAGIAAVVAPVMNTALSLRYRPNG
jgi:hypothetical protein